MKILLGTNTLFGIENLEIQVVIAIVMAALWIVLIKKYPMKTDIRSLVLVAMFTIIATIASLYLSIRLPLFGVDSLRIGFAQILLAIGGACLSPGYAFLMGIVYDGLGLVLSPTTPFLGFTLNSVLACVIPSVWYRTKHPQNMMKIVDGLLVGITLFALCYLQLTPELKISDVLVEDQLRMFMSLFVVLVCVILIISLHFILKKWGTERAMQVTNWMFVVLMIEILIQFLSTPFWLQFLYGIPWQASLFLRVMKAAVMVPLNTIIGVVTLKALRFVK